MIKKFAFMAVVVLLTLSCFIPDSMAQNKGAGTFTSPTIGAKFVLIPAGSFTMGSPVSENERVVTNKGTDIESQHRVTISQPFFLQTTEVTQGQWKRVMGNNPSGFSSCGDGCPVENVSWYDVQEFIGKLNKLEGTDKYRLPTEAQWEYAARAGTTTAYHWGNSPDCSKANYGNFQYEDISNIECKGTNPGETMKVGSFTPNAWGLYDMSGNVFEWVQDWLGLYPTGSVTDPVGPASGSVRVVRGGSWDYDAESCRAASRYDSAPGDRDSYLGFRLLRTR